MQAAGLNLLFDTGRGVLMRLSAAGIGPPGIHVVFLTHLHSDHTTDLNDILTMQWTMNLEPSPLRIVGPPGTADFCELTLSALERDIGWRLEHHADLTWRPKLDIHEVTDGLAFEDGGVRVTAAPTLHPPVDPTVGFRIDHDGRSVVVGGDSVPCEGLDRLCAGADVYVQTVLRTPLITALGVGRLADILDYHSSTTDAAQTAARAGVGRLIFTHLMPPPAPGTEENWIADARAHFDGEVVVGHDLWSIEV